MKVSLAWSYILNKRVKKTCRAGCNTTKPDILGNEEHGKIREAIVTPLHWKLRLEEEIKLSRFSVTKYSPRTHNEVVIS